ncbi:MAG: hypothetical protein IH946_04490 [Bacteroidetes bacterium]|nr:hypothetical protein [Bacteroidota bacterium]
MKILSALFIVTIGLISCEPNADLPLLNGCWTRSYEEESSGDHEIFRPCDYREFSPSWFRKVYVFKENNECEYLVLSPVDAHYFENGRWQYFPKTKQISIRNMDNQIVETFKITKLKKDLLKIER